ncbi:TRAP transporter large permease subunit [Paenibacillus brevis]|uniref:Citrate transporter n=1 Tax=Paenibacillus brevis TaxID=2841508 RepID=A0ABS6FNM1_9BACL|nr:TRAP transporter large permease subunit [Paenibacillus brevis]MBU5671038.1 citrate transporter [Paenibacillus brevis]
METLQVIGILLVFAVFVALMMMRKLPTLLALPLMAVLLAAVAGIPFISSDPEAFTIAKGVLAGGAMRLSTAIAGLIFGAWFGQILNKVGITKTIIRKAAELAGDKPLAIAIVFFLAASVIFAAASGLGMVILVGTITIPIMLTAGLKPFVSGLVVLLANAVGVTFNVSNWAIYTDVLGIPTSEVASYSVLCGLPLILLALVMIVFYTKKGGKVKKAWAMPAKQDPSGGPETKNVRSIALISPLVPVLLVFLLKLDIVSAVFVGAAVTLLLSTPKRPVHVLSSALVEGIQDVAGALGLMIGIGMLLAAVTAPEVAALIQPLIEGILPSSPLTFVLVFTLLSPLAIYRGPLNVWGLGSGIAALMVAGGMAPIAAMLALRIVSNLQAVSDPTNSHNVWVADFTKTDIVEILKKTVPWMILIVFVSMIIAAFYAF